MTLLRLLAVSAIATAISVSPVSADLAKASAWLGVQLTPVPKSLAAHLGLENTGVMISNVVAGSPADRAGMKRFDIVVEADGREVTNKVEDFCSHVCVLPPGTSLELTVYREGEKTKLIVELGKKPDSWETLEFIYKDSDPDVTYLKEFGLSGKILRPTPEGGWALEDLGVIPEKWDVREYIKKLPGYIAESRDLEIDQLKRVDKQGKVLHIQRDKDGKIEVKRYQADDGEKKAEVKNYKDMIELRKGDREAYDLLMSAQRRGVRYYLKKYREDWPFKQFIPPEEADRKWREWRDKFFQGPLDKLKENVKPPRFFDPQPREPKLNIVPSPESKTKPKISFDIDADGRITVHMEDKSGNLKKTFKSADELKKYSPKLYKQFKDLETKMRGESGTDYLLVP